MLPIPKIDSTVQILIKLYGRIASGEYYESHQQLRVITARYLKQSNYDAAADILAGGAKALLSAPGASASGGDLAIMLVTDVYNKAEWELSDDEVGKKRKSTRSCSRFLGKSEAQFCSAASISARYI